MSLIDIIDLLLRRLGDTVGRNGEQGRKWKTENQNDLLSVVLCNKPQIRTAAGAMARDDVR